MAKRWVVCADGYVRQRAIQDWRIEWDKKYWSGETYFERKEDAQKAALKQQEGRVEALSLTIKARVEILNGLHVQMADNLAELERRRRRLPKK